MKNNILAISETQSDSLKVALSQKIDTLTQMSGEEILRMTIDTLTTWGLKVIAAIVVYFIGKWLIKKVKNIIKIIFEKRSIDPSLSSFIISVANISLTVILFIVIVSIVGVPTSTFAAILAAGGLAVGMALSGTLQNFAGGIMILLFKPFKVGDYIEAGGVSGTVDAINITTTQIHTPDNKTIFLPNGTLPNNNIQNYSTSAIRRVEWTINVSYEDNIDKGLKLLLDYMNNDKRVLKNPEEPFAAISKLSDSSVELIARAWTLKENYWSLYFDMNKQIYEDFINQGMTFPYPKLDIYINDKKQD